MKPKFVNINSDDLIALENGYVYYWPTTNCGAYSSACLRSIADRLDELNEEWDDTIQSEVGVDTNI